MPGAFEPEPTTGQRIFQVATTGGDADDGSAGSPWRRLSHAAAQALEPGDLVLVEPGVSVEDLALTRSGAEVLPVTTAVSIIGSDTLRFPAGTDLSGVDLTAHADELSLYVYRSWRAHSGVYRIVETGGDAVEPLGARGRRRLQPGGRRARRRHRAQHRHRRLHRLSQRLPGPRPTTA